MKSQADAQRAHDMLMAVILGDIPIRPAAADRSALAQAVGVLCWLLEHEHNGAFANSLAALDADAAAAGYTLNRSYDHGW